MRGKPACADGLMGSRGVQVEFQEVFSRIEKWRASEELRLAPHDEATEGRRTALVDLVTRTQTASLKATVIKQTD